MEEMREICLEAVLPTETSTVSLSPRASAENLHFFPVNSIVAIFAPSVDGGEMEERRKIVLEGPSQRNFDSCRSDCINPRICGF